MSTIVTPVGQCVIMQGVSWGTYTCLLADFTDSRGTRIAYNQGALESMAPSFRHEQIADLLADVVKIVDEARGQDFVPALKIRGVQAFNIKPWAHAHDLNPVPHGGLNIPDNIAILDNGAENATHGGFSLESHGGQFTGKSHEPFVATAGAEQGKANRQAMHFGDRKIDLRCAQGASNAR